MIPGFDHAKTLGFASTEEGRKRATMFLWRKYHYIQSNVITLNLSLMLMGMAAFALHPDDIGDRLAHATAVLFGCVGLRSIVDSQLPQLDFDTILQTQMNLTIYLLGVIVVESAVLHFFHSRLGAINHAVVAFVDGGCSLLLLSAVAGCIVQTLILRSSHLRRKPL